MMEKIKERHGLLLFVLGLLASAFACLYLFYGLKWSNPVLLTYALKLRLPKVLAILLTATAIGGASLVFQTIVHNRIVTPGLLGMDALYSFLHTVIVFFAGSGSLLATNANLAFAVDLFLMGLLSMAIYGYLFKKTRHNMLYILLIGVVLSSFFSSIQGTLIRIMDPNEYDALLTTLVASFSRINAGILTFAALVLLLLSLVLYRDLALLDVLSLGKSQAINLGINYDRCVRKLLLGVALAMAVATALVGPLAFLGFIIANLSRQIFKTYRHKILISGAILLGMIALLAGQFLVEKVFTYTVPVSVFVTLFGGIYFLYLLLREERQ